MTPTEWFERCYRWERRLFPTWWRTEGESSRLLDRQDTIKVNGTLTMRQEPENQASKLLLSGQQQEDNDGVLAEQCFQIALQILSKAQRNGKKRAYRRLTAKCIPYRPAPVSLLSGSFGKCLAAEGRGIFNAVDKNRQDSERHDGSRATDLVASGIRLATH